MPSGERSPTSTSPVVASNTRPSGMGPTGMTRPRGVASSGTAAAGSGALGKRLGGVGHGLRSWPCLVSWVATGDQQSRQGHNYAVPGSGGDASSGHRTSHQDLQVGRLSSPGGGVGGDHHPPRLP
jgi:PPE-repeat protein